ncbi:XK-related protein 8 [Larimichthys crocea]|uniref:XK-related protein 8 n=1 Tax=Larimichthys crocea TaxID=215358 RepID=UPI000900F652|nr:XK-related protein 8 [Larimichthys crocea]
MGVFKYSPVDFLFTCVGLVFLLLDIALDIWAAVSFFQEKAYVSLAVLMLFLVGSSVLVQAFSWLWYSYDDSDKLTKVEKCLSVGQLKLLHVLQLGIYIRHAGVVELSVCSIFSGLADISGDYAVYLNHDLSMLRLVETFSESSPQLVLMLTIILQRGELDPVTVLKAIGSASAIAFSVTTYHRSLRNFLPEKKQQPMTSSVVYFLWNLCLLSSRITALALFASVLPCFIFTHFICSWIVLFFFVWRSKTDFMDTPCGERLYRATVGLIWYFNWFNVVKGKTRFRTLLYHGYMLLDIVFLCSWWCWSKMTTQAPYFETVHYAIVTVVVVVGVYMLGLLLKMIYYKRYHPNHSKEELKGDASEKTRVGMGPTRKHEDKHGDEPDGVAFRTMALDIEADIEADLVTDSNEPSQPPPEVKRCNKRMRKLAENFYC